MGVEFGPVSETLESELRTWVRRHGVVFWLDADDHYSDFVDHLQSNASNGGLPYRVFAYQGSHLELLMALEHCVGGVERPRLVVHLPAFNEESVKDTPLFELYAAGARFRKKLDTLVKEAAAGRVRPDDVASFKEQPGLTLAQADAWLTDCLQGDGGELAGRIKSLGLVDAMGVLLSTKGGKFGELKTRVFASQEAIGSFWSHLQAASGLSETWKQAGLPPGSVRANDVAFVLASWALCVEYVDDLRRDPVAERLTGIEDLPRKTIDACIELAQHLREAHSAFYATTADETEAWLVDEIDNARAEDLGKVDTFRFEDGKVLDGALHSLQEGQYKSAFDAACLRIDGRSFWLNEQPSRRAEWELVRDAAKLGLALEKAGSELKAKGHTQALERYQKRGAVVDLQHRQLEQQRAALLYPQLPEFGRLRDILDVMRQRWRTWADGWAHEFNQLCRKEGFLPELSLQQRSLFDEVVCAQSPDDETTALFMIDALRYEMATELFEELQGTPATSVHLNARLAELPTITSVGMNVLAPVVNNGVLRPALRGQSFLGFSTGEFRVSDSETRRKAMQGRVGGSTCPMLSLGDVLERDSTSLRQAIARARLVIVHSTEIDDAGEKNVGPSVFQQSLQRLRAAWRMLREAGVKRFFFTADHGFLLVDAATVSTQAHGRKIDPKRRHAFATEAINHDGEVCVALSDLRYEGVDGHLMFPESTAVFDTGNKRRTFVHGGNSLQERVIPVLTVDHRAGAGASTVRYRVEAEALEGVAGMHCLKATVRAAAQTTLNFGGVKELELALQVVDAEGVHVELCQARGQARLSGGAIVAEVERPFEVFFRLLGRTDARVQVEVAHHGAQAAVDSAVVERRYAVAPDGRGGGVENPEAQPTQAIWLDKLEDEGVRKLFAHLANHGSITEPEVASMLGGARAARKFARKFEEYAACAPFGVHIENQAGVKRYARDGRSED